MCARTGRRWKKDLPWNPGLQRKGCVKTTIVTSMHGHLVHIPPTCQAQLQRAGWGIGLPVETAAPPWRAYLCAFAAPPPRGGGDPSHTSPFGETTTKFHTSVLKKSMFWVDRVEIPHYPGLVRRKSSTLSWVSAEDGSLLHTIMV